LNDFIQPSKRCADQAYFWTAEWQAGEREADEDIAAGRTQLFDDVDAAIRALRQARDEEAEPPSA